MKTHRKRLRSNRSVPLVQGVLFLLIALLTALATNYALAKGTAEDLKAEALDAQVMEIADELMCPVCRGQSVAESHAELAIDMKKVIRTKLKEGESRKEIIAYFVDRYGESILGAPPPRGSGLLLWALPGVAILLGGGMIIRFIRRRGGNGAGENMGDGAAGETQSGADYAAKLEEELKEFDS